MSLLLCSGAQSSKRQRCDAGEASVDAYLAQLGQESQHPAQQQLPGQPPQQLLQDLDQLSAGSGGGMGGAGTLVADLRTRSMPTFEDDLDEDEANLDNVMEDGLEMGQLIDDALHALEAGDLDGISDDDMSDDHDHSDDDMDADDGQD